jgi:ABC-2 type transport system permease protein
MAGIAATPQQTQNGAPPMASRFSLRWDHVRALLWLRWKLTVRSHTHSARQIVGFIFTAIFLLGLAAVLGLGTTAGYLLLDRPDAAQLLYIVLVGLWLAWAAFPLMQYTLNEGLDVTKLQTYPLTRGEQMVSLLLATLLDMSTIVILSLLAAVIVGWHASLPAVLITVVALALVYVLIVTTSQLLLAALMGILRSRRFRDLMVVFFALFGVSCALINQFVSRAMIGFRPGDFASWHLERYLQWFPTGFGARAIILADQGSYVAALPWLGVMLALAVVMIVVWAWVLERGITTAESAGAGVRRRSRRGRAGVAVAGGNGGVAVAGAAAEVGSVRSGWGPFSGPALAIADKDRRYFWRDPQIKASLVSTLVLLVFVLLPSIFSGRRVELTGSDGGLGIPIAPWQVFIAPLPALLITLNLAQNAFGLEREGLQTLFLFPVKPLDILRGKNLAVAVVAGSVSALMTVLVAALGGAWSNVPLALGYGIAAILVLLGCGNLISVFIPMRVRRMRMGQGNFAASGNGCLRTLLMFVATMATYALLAPVVAALLLPLILSHSEWLVITLPASVLYAIVFYEVVTRIAASQLLMRAPDILQATVPDN